VKHHSPQTRVARRFLRLMAATARAESKRLGRQVSIPEITGNLADCLAGSDSTVTHRLGAEWFKPAPAPAADPAAPWPLPFAR